MAFTIKKRESYQWTVEHVISKEDGKPEVMRFNAEFKALSKSKVKELAERIGNGMKDDEFLDDALIGWSGLKDETGDFAYTDSNLERLLESFPGLAGSIYTAWFESVSGGLGGVAAVLLGAAARKN